MKWLKEVSIFIVCMLFFPTIIRAECPYNFQSHLKKVASNINYDYSYIENNDDAIFSIRFTNVSLKLKIYDAYHNKEYSGKEEFILSGFESGNQYRFEVRANIEAESTVTIPIVVDDKFVDYTYTFANDTDCMGQPITNFYVNLPKYNPYYKDPLCKGMKNYKLCQKWASHNLDYENFKNEMLEIINNEEAEKVKPNIKENISVFDKIVDFISDYYIILLIVGVIIVITVIYLLKNRDKGFEGW